jgi:Protein of unknown function (DUF3060)
MSAIMIRVPVVIATSIFGALAGACPSGAASAPGGRWAVPIDVAPPTISTNGGAVTYDCGNQSPISIVGANSTIALTGSCGEVDVNGTANTVNLQTVAVIKANGTGNHVRWQAGPGGTVPQISNTGINNTVNGPGGA